MSDLTGVASCVHEAGGILSVDAVHLAPHRRIHMTRDGVDAVFCSTYKMFGAHMGFAAIADRVLDRLGTLNHAFLDGQAKLELGVQNFEGMAALQGVMQYFRDLAATAGIGDGDVYDAVFKAIATYEEMLSRQLIGGLREIGGVRVYGIADPEQCGMRTPTVAFTVEGRSPADVAKWLGVRGSGVNHGHMYAPRVIERLGLRDRGGIVRASLCHYNTTAEIERLVDAVREIAAAKGCA